MVKLGKMFKKMATGQESAKDASSDFEALQVLIEPYAFNPFQMQTVCDLQQQVGLPIFPTICGWPTYSWEDFFDVYPTGPFPPFLVSVPRGSVWPALPLSWPVGN